MNHVSSFKELNTYKLAKEISFECNYLDESQHKELINKCEIMGKMINNMIQKSNEFCKNNE
jgi:hypothetical protein